MTDIKTERLTLRPYRPGDAALIHRLISNLRVFFWRTEPGTRTEAEERLAQSLKAHCEKGLGWWAVFRNGRGDDPAAFLGQVCLQPLRGTGYIELGYHFLPDAWGHGYATEAARALLEYGFRALRLDRIVAVAMPDNEASLRVIQKLGLSYIEDRMHAGSVHKLFALSREAHLSPRDAVSQEP